MLEDTLMLLKNALGIEAVSMAYTLDDTHKCEKMALGIIEYRVELDNC